MPYDIVRPSSDKQLLPSIAGIKKPEESMISGGELLRQGVRTAARAGETAIGLPFDVLQGVGHLSNILTNITTGQVSPVLADLPLPTSEKIRNYFTKPIAEYFGGEGYLDPKGKGEELSDDIVSDLTALLIPIGGKLPFKKALMTAGFGNLAKFAAKQFELPDLAQEGVKLGTMLAVNFAGPKKFKELSESLYEDAKSSLPKGAEVSSKPFEPVLNKLTELAKKKDLPQGWLSKVSYLSDSIVNKKISVEDVWDLSKDINNVFYGQAKPSAFKRAFSELKKGINNTLKVYGKENPTFFNSLTHANDIYSSLKKSEHVSSLLDKYITPGGYSLATLGTLLGWNSPVALAKTVVGGEIGRTSLKTINILKESPIARGYFYKTIGEAIKKNSKGVAHYAKKLDKEFARELGTTEGSTTKYSVIR